MFEKKRRKKREVEWGKDRKGKRRQNEQYYFIV